MLNVITRVRADNFRCFERFDFEPMQINLILGPNGSGKSSFLDLLHSLFLFTSGWSSVDELFPMEQRARFSRRAEKSTSFRIDGHYGQRSLTLEYSYLLDVVHAKNGHARIDHEEVIVDGERVYAYDGQTVSLREPGRMSSYRFSGKMSALSTIPAERGSLLSDCLGEFRKLWVIRPIPQIIGSVSHEDVSWLKPDLSNFSDWFRGIIQSDPKLSSRINVNIRQVIEGYEGFSFEPVGYGANRPRELLLRFRGKSNITQRPGLSIDELSDGQRLLLALYTMLHFVVGNGYTLCIDEPENYLGLPEIQPWLDKLQDVAEKRKSQVFMVSHHPRVINLLAASYGYWFERKGTGPVKPHRIQTQNKKATANGITLATLIERGWIYD